MSTMKTMQVALLLCMLVFCNGCRFNKPTGEHYSTTPSPPSGEAQLVIYRMAEGAGEDRVYGLTVDGERRAGMLHGGYASLTVAPGTHELETNPDFTLRAWLPGILIITLPFIIYGELIADTTANATVEMVAGQTTYVRCRLAEDQLEVVSAESALPQLRECREQ